MARRNIVTINVDKDYFDKVFEPKRKELSKKFGINLTQRNYTSLLYKSNGKINNKKFNPDKFMFSKYSKEEFF